VTPSVPVGIPGLRDGAVPGNQVLAAAGANDVGTDCPRAPAQVGCQPRPGWWKAGFPLWRGGGSGGERPFGAEVARAAGPPEGGPCAVLGSYPDWEGRGNGPCCGELGETAPGAQLVAGQSPGAAGKVAAAWGRSSQRAASGAGLPPAAAAAAAAAVAAAASAAGRLQRGWGVAGPAERPVCSPGGRMPAGRAARAVSGLGVSWLHGKSSGVPGVVQPPAATFGASWAELQFHSAPAVGPLLCSPSVRRGGYSR
jgi:hypothetical protein